MDNAETLRSIICKSNLSLNIVNGDTIDTRVSSTTNIRKTYNTEAENAGIAPSSATLSIAMEKRMISSGIVKYKYNSR
ncbi:MAG: hypothetical protein IIW93_01745 [Bacteroidaceae bacterium]|jgi:hypothetical protein|nr:hypothetical protein [Bacteroidaceae bacterium]